jgi:hypothetical protein
MVKSSKVHTKIQYDAEIKVTQVSERSALNLRSTAIQPCALLQHSCNPCINMQAECVGLCVMDLLQTAQILCIYVLYYMSYCLSSLYRCWFCCMWLQEISITGISITGAPWGILWCNSGPSCNTESSNWCRNVYIHNSSISHLIGLENNKKNICFLETFVVFRLSLQYTCNVIMTK